MGRRNYLLGALTLVACGPSIPHPESSSPIGASDAADTSDTSKPAEPAASTARPVRVAFGPTDAVLELSFGRFGPCEVEEDSSTKVFVVYCDKAGAGEKEGILVNFYLPGYWDPGPFDAESVALTIREQLGPETTLEKAFTATDPASGAPNYFLSLSAVYPEEQSGQAFIVKVAPLQGAVYSMFHSVMFSGAAETMRDTIRGWLDENLDTRARILARVAPDAAWLPFLEKFEGR